MITRDARISPCGLYRYSLSRRWDIFLPMGLVLGINPSTADAERDDATVRKLIGFSKRWGWGGFYLGNPFAFRSTDQRGLLTAADPVGPGNDSELCTLRALSCQIVCAWGSAKTPEVRKLLDERLRVMAPLFAGRDLLCLGTTADGSPKHPLMLSYSTPLEPWAPPRRGAVASGGAG